MRTVRWVVAAVVVLFFGYCGSKACISFVQFGARSKEAEPRSNLRVLATRQRAFFADAGRWATSFEELGFSPENGNRFRYALAPDDTLAGADGGAHVVIEASARVVPPPSEALRAAIPLDGWTALDAGAFVIFASGDIDGDPGVSVWRVSSLDLPCEGAHGADVPCRVVDDLE